MYNIEKELNKYIYDLCEEKGIPLELRWRCFGDKFLFYKDDKEFVIACVEYYAKDIEDIKSLIMTYIETRWEDEECWKNISRSNYRVAIYVMDITNMDGWYDVVMGGSISNN